MIIYNYTMSTIYIKFYGLWTFSGIKVPKNIFKYFRSKSNQYKTVNELTSLPVCLPIWHPSQQSLFWSLPLARRSHDQFPLRTSQALISQPPPPLDSDLWTRTCGSSTHGALKTRRCFVLDSWIVPAWSLKNK